MKPFVIGLAALWASVVGLVGQGVSVEVLLDQQQFLPGESLILKVRIRNDSGRDLTFGQDNGWLTFAIEDGKRLPVPSLGPVPVQGEFTLESGTTGTKKVDIAPYFSLDQIGRYSVTAILGVPNWTQTIQSKPARFDVFKGNDLWEKDFGVPTRSENANALPEFRRYALVQTLHANAPKLYFRLTDTREAKTYRVFPLGPLVSFSNLEPQMDRFSNLHVLFQSSARTFTHCLINPDGVLIARETYEYSDSRPVLRPEKDGRILVAGGARRYTLSDLPPTQSPESLSNTNARLP